MRAARPGELKAGWITKERDIGYAWGGAGASKADGHMLNSFFTYIKGLHDKTLVHELEARGYDLTTLRFSIRQREAASPVPHPEEHGADPEEGRREGSER